MGGAWSRREADDRMISFQQVARNLRAIRGGTAGRVARWPSIRDEYPEPQDPAAALQLALDWIARAQQATADGGVSAGYHIAPRRWAASYPETTGYTITTLLEVCQTLSLPEAERQRLLASATRMADWLLTLQFDDGAFPAGQPGQGETRRRSVFNTGQILDGLLAAGAADLPGDYLSAAERAADWMTATLNPRTGEWTDHIYDRDCRTYYARACFLLAKAAFVPSFPRADQYQAAAARFGQWCLTQRRANDWIDRCSFFTPAMRRPSQVLHTIAYTIEGLLELGIALDDDALRQAAIAASWRLLRRFEIDGRLAGEYDSNWRPTASYVCVTGAAQMGRIWGRVYECNHDPRFLNGLLKINDCLRHVQPRGNAPAEVRGGFSGSIPIAGGYQPNSWPNWAAKFACDSWLIEHRLRCCLTVPHRLESAR